MLFISLSPRRKVIIFNLNFIVVYQKLEEKKYESAIYKIALSSGLYQNFACSGIFHDATEGVTKN